MTYAARLLAPLLLLGFPLLVLASLGLLRPAARTTRRRAILLAIVATIASSTAFSKEDPGPPDKPSGFYPVFRLFRDLDNMIRFLNVKVLLEQQQNQ